MSETSQEWRGKVGGMSDEERDAFLERGVVMRLACLDENGFPYVVPCWHEWRDGAFWVVPRQRSVWAEHMKRDPRVSFTVDVPDTLEKVIGQGNAELVEEVGRDEVGAALSPGQREHGHVRALTTREARDRSRVLVVRMRHDVHRARRRAQLEERLPQAAGAAIFRQVNLRADAGR